MHSKNYPDGTVFELLVEESFSCGYKQAFDEFSKIVVDRYPSIRIEGQNYAPSYARALIAQLLTYSKIALIALYACTMIFFVGNAVETYLISTGAFEIAYNGVPIWSKLDVGRIPSPQELIQIIESHNRLSASAYSDLQQHYH
uniref:Selenoprotein T n=1 Tax=Romanomermis culicivorax TaxID=13658 RepID=A0A915J6U8_ROMCU